MFCNSLLLWFGRQSGRQSFSALESMEPTRSKTNNHMKCITYLNWKSTLNLSAFSALFFVLFRFPLHFKLKYYAAESEDSSDDCRVSFFTYDPREQKQISMVINLECFTSNFFFSQNIVIRRPISGINFRAFIYRICKIFWSRYFSVN